MHKHLTDELLVELYDQQGLTTGQIGQLYGYTRERIRQRLRGLGVASRRAVLDAEVLQQLYVQSRLSIKEIAKRLGVGDAIVSREINRYGITRPAAMRALDLALTKHERTEVEDLYITQGLTQVECAARLGIPVPLFQELLTRLGINYRHTKRSKFHNKITADDLRRLYVAERRTMADIGRIYGCSDWVVSHHLKRFGLADPSRRNRQPNSKKPQSRYSLDADELRRLYVDEHRTMEAIAEICGCAESVISRHLKNLGLSNPSRRNRQPARTRAERHK